jgi:hypothetical protein
MYSKPTFQDSNGWEFLELKVLLIQSKFMPRKHSITQKLETQHHKFSHIQEEPIPQQHKPPLPQKDHR